MDFPELTRVLLGSEPSASLTRLVEPAPNAYGITEVFQALQHLEGLLEPLTLELELEAVDPELRMALEPVEIDDPHHQLTCPELPDVSPWRRLPTPQVHQCTQLTATEVRDWMEHVLQGRSDAPLPVVWSLLTATACRAFTPSVLPQPLQLFTPDRSAFDAPCAPTSSGTWLAGPTGGSGIFSPLRLEFRQEGHRITLFLAAIWPFWADPAQLGHALLMQRLRALLDLGWAVERVDAPFQALTVANNWT